MGEVGLRTKVERILLELAAEQATGALTVTDPDGEQSVVWFRDGLVYSVSVPGRRPLLGVRLMSSGSLTPESLAEALEVQRTELQGWRLGELLVHLGFVDRDVVEAFVLEQVRDQVADLLHWRVKAHKFCGGRRTRQDVAPPVEVAELLEEARLREERWHQIADRVGGAEAVPVLSTSDAAASDVVLGPYDWALLCKVDGQRTIADLADDCGFTIYEAGQVVEGLLGAGLVEVEVPAAPAPVAAPNPPLTDVATSVARVTAALTDMLGPARNVDGDARRSPFTRAPELRSVAPVVPLVKKEPTPDVAEEIARLEAERAAAQEAAERLEQARAAAEQAKERLAQAQRLEAERVAAEQEIARLEAERLDAERLAAENEIARLEAERLEAERLAAEEAERLAAEEAERLAAEEAARLEAERLEAERLEAERLEAERLEAERLAAEEAERLAAEEAARLEAERLEAERLEAERLEAERLEAERLAAEEAARLEAERLEAERLEAERLAAEEDERLAAEEAARLEAERLEAERLEAERLEAERLEAERLEAERLEAERLAAEEAERLAEEAARLAAVDSGPLDDAGGERADQDALLEAAMSGPVPGLAPLDRPGFAALLTEFDRDSAVAGRTQAAESEAEAEQPAAEEGADADSADPTREVHQPVTVGAPSEQTDTAALLRELSSLSGLSDGPTAVPSPAARPAPRKPAPAPEPPKRRRGGLFRR